MSHLVRSTREIRLHGLDRFLSKDAEKEIVLIDSPSLLNLSSSRVDFKSILSEMRCGSETRVLVYNVYGDVAKSWNACGAPTINVNHIDAILFALSKSKCTITIVTSSVEAMRFAAIHLKRKRLVFVTNAKSKFKDIRYVDASEIMTKCFHPKPDDASVAARAAKTHDTPDTPDTPDAADAADDAADAADDAADAADEDVSM